MKPRKLPRDSRELGIVWYLIPAFWVAAAIAGFVVLAYWPALLADPLPLETQAAGSVPPITPYAGAALSVPEASSVFTERRWEVTEPVDPF